MKTNIHNTFEKSYSYVLAILVLLIVPSCSPQKTPSIPPTIGSSQNNGTQNEQAGSDSEPVTGLGLSIPPTRNFSIQNANTTTPADVSAEVFYGGFGGPGPCDNYAGGLAVDQYAQTEADWLEPIVIALCGVQGGANIDATLQTPDGKIVSEIIRASDPFYRYSPSINSQTGKYKFTFSDGNVKVQFIVRVSMPNEPRMFYLENDRVYYLYGVVPNERIRFFQYVGSSGMRAAFVGWQEYFANENGQLIIRLSQEKDGFYIPVGDVSGEIPSVRIGGQMYTLGILK